MAKKLIKYGKFLMSVALIFCLIAPLYASLSASDGSAFVTKSEFDSALADFNARLTTFEAGINSKIDSQVTSYLDRNGIWSGVKQDVGDFDDFGVWFNNSSFTNYGTWSLVGLSTFARKTPNSRPEISLDNLTTHFIPQQYNMDATTAFNSATGIKLLNAGCYVEKVLCDDISKSGMFTCLMLFRNDWNGDKAPTYDSTRNIWYIDSGSGNQWSEQLKSWTSVSDFSISNIMKLNPVGSYGGMYASCVNTLKIDHAVGHYNTSVIEEVKIVDQYDNIKFQFSLFDRPLEFNNINPPTEANFGHWNTQSWPFTPYLMLPKFFVRKNDKLKWRVTLYASGRDTDGKIYLCGVPNANLYMCKIEDAMVY